MKHNKPTKPQTVEVSSLEFFATPVENTRELRYTLYYITPNNHPGKVSNLTRELLESKMATLLEQKASITRIVKYTKDYTVTNLTPTPHHN